MRTGSVLARCGVVLLLGACGGGGEEPGGGSCTPGPSAAIGITSAGVAPKAVCVLPAGTVTFTNNDSVAHDIESTSCTELALGSIAPAASAPATFPAAKVCSFHDTTKPGNAAFEGTVAVTTGPATGPGY